MKIPAGNGYTITIKQIERSGYPWVVRLYKRGFLGKRLVGSDWFLNPEPYIRVKPHAGSSTPDEAHQVEEYDNFVLKEKLKIETFVADAIHELLLDGTVYPLLSWVIEEKAYAQQTPMGPQEAQGVSYEGPRLSLVSVEHVWLPDDVDDDDWETKPVIRYVDEMTLEELKRRSQQEYGWVRANVEKLTPSDEEPECTEQQKADAVQSYEMELPPELRTIKRYEAFLNWNIGGETSEPIIVEVEREGFHGSACPQAG